MNEEFNELELEEQERIIDEVVRNILILLYKLEIVKPNKKHNATKEQIKHELTSEEIGEIYQSNKMLLEVLNGLDLSLLHHIPISERKLSDFEIRQIRAIFNKKGKELLNKTLEKYPEAHFLIGNFSDDLFKQDKKLSDLIEENIKEAEETAKRYKEDEKSLKKQEAQVISELSKTNPDIIKFISNKELKNELTQSYFNLDYEEALKTYLCIIQSVRNIEDKTIFKDLLDDLMKRINTPELFIFFTDLTKEMERYKEKVNNFYLDAFIEFRNGLKNKKSDYFKINERIETLKANVKNNFSITKRNDEVDKLKYLYPTIKNNNEIIISEDTKIIKNKSTTFIRKNDNSQELEFLNHFSNSYGADINGEDLLKGQGTLIIGALIDEIIRQYNNNINFNIKPDYLTIKIEDLYKASGLWNEETEEAIKTHNARPQTIINNYLNFIERSKFNTKGLKSFSFFTIEEIITRAEKEDKLKVSINDEIIAYKLSLNNFFKSDEYLKLKHHNIRPIDTLTPKQALVNTYRTEERNKNFINEDYLLSASGLFAFGTYYQNYSKTHRSDKFKEAQEDLKNNVIDFANEKAELIQDNKEDTIYKIIKNAYDLKQQEITEDLAESIENKNIITYHIVNAYTTELYPDATNNEKDIIYQRINKDNLYTDEELKEIIKNLMHEIKEIKQDLRKNPTKKKKKTFRTLDEIKKIASSIKQEDKAEAYYKYMNSKKNLTLTDEEIINGLKNFQLQFNAFGTLRQFSNDESIELDKIKKYVCNTYGESKLLKDLSQEQVNQVIAYFKESKKQAEPEESHELTPEKQRLLNEFYNNIGGRKRNNNYSKPESIFIDDEEEPEAPNGQTTLFDYDINDDDLPF